MNTGREREATLVGVFLVLVIIFTLLGSTLAYFIWRGNITSINFTVTRSFECSGDMGGPITSNQLAPASCTNSTYAIQREVTINPVINSPGVSIYMDLWLDVEQMDPGLAESSNFKYAFTKNPNSCTDSIIESGTFQAKERIELLSRKPFTYQINLVERPDLSQTYYLYVWLDAAETDSATQDNNFTLTLGGECTQGEYVEEGAVMLINKANDLNITTYNSGNTAEMYTFSQPATTQLGATIDYRYIGSNPNNYIEFNNETWRIIGVFDGKIKLIKDSPIGYISMDYKLAGVGSSDSEYGSSDWVDSQLMYMLNSNDIPNNIALKSGYTYTNDIIKDTNNRILYQNGCTPTSISKTATSYNCTTSPWSLNSKALSQVSDTIYYLGGSSEFEGHSARTYYEFERGNTKYNNTRSLNWTGKVGIMYPSDYAYTFAYGVDETCYSNTFSCNTSNPDSSWLFNEDLQWAMSPYTRHSFKVFGITQTGYCSHGYVYWNNVGVRPVVYLKPDTILIGNGTNDSNIYKIA